MERSLAREDEVEERLRSDEEEEEEGEEGWDDWCSDGDDAGGGLLCLFCSTRFDADSPLFEHCAAEHRFHFRDCEGAGAGFLRAHQAHQLRPLQGAPTAILGSE